MDEKYRILNRDIIKYIAMITMLLNHISTVFMEPGTFLAEVFLDIGYFTAITMCYFLVEGFHHTRSRKKYGQRLAVFALISEIPYCLAFTEQGVIEFYGLNMIFTLLLCFWILCAMENIPAGPVRNILIALLIFLSLFCDWALLAPVFTLLFAWARNSKKRLKIAFTAAAAMFGVMSLAGGSERFSTGTNILYALGCMAGIALSGIVIACFYNGRRAERGRKFSKWFFYWFYPVHLLILGVLRVYLLTL